MAALFSFLALYTWNMRTGYLDTVTERSGLEVTGHLLRPVVWVKDAVSGVWHQYITLVGVAEENTRLRDELRKAEQYLAFVREEQAELTRLRALMGLQAPEGWAAIGTRVLAGRFGPGAVLETVMIDRGFASGASPGTPVITHQGVAGQVLKASPDTAVVLLLTDRAFRTAVITQEGRVPGVIAGTGAHMNLDVRYMAPTAVVKPGEILITSGQDGNFPKGIPVARVISVQQATETLFLQVQAVPLVPLETMEEALLLSQPQMRSSQPPLPKHLMETLAHLPATEKPAGTVHAGNGSTPARQTGNATATPRRGGGSTPARRSQ